MRPKYGDCVSCTFSEDHALCDICRDSDQWEPDESEGEIITTNIKTYHTMKFYGKRNDTTRNKNHEHRK